jgi:SAM-dependent methyltransferase
MENQFIDSENSSTHWKYFDSFNHRVLDLGCGRWDVKVFEEMSPIYFKNKGANLVVGVDSSEYEIDYYSNECSNNDGYIFRREWINSTEVVRNLINEYNITAIKCDIEGDEKFLLELTEEDLADIKEIGIEYHSKELRDQFVIKFLNWNFTLKEHMKFINNPEQMGVLFGFKNN